MVWGSMYGNTEAMMNAVAEDLAHRHPLIFDAARTHVSYMLPSLWSRRGVMIGAPTYETSLFPPVANVLDMAGHKRLRNKQVAMFGSYGWSGGARRVVEQRVEELCGSGSTPSSSTAAPPRGAAPGRGFRRALC